MEQMELTEDHIIKKRDRKTRALFRRFDGYCYQSKNLYNAVNYRIRQCFRISGKLQLQEELEEWEEEMVREINAAIALYNRGRPGKRQMQPVSADNAFIADAYFLSWYLKTTEEYRAMPFAASAQICIQVLCQNWKAYCKGAEAFRKDPSKFLGIPNPPGYLDKEAGRNPIGIAGQSLRLDEKGRVLKPAFLKGVVLKLRHNRPIRQIRIITESKRIRIRVIFREEVKGSSGKGVLSIDPGVNNRMAAVTDTGAGPVLINGRPLKSMNQYYNKQLAALRSESMTKNREAATRRIRTLTEKRNRKVKDYMHKASRAIVQYAVENEIGTIVIGRNRGWKQNLRKKNRERKWNVRKGNITNQNFVSIPIYRMIQMIRYKANLVGIRVITINEAYTSGTSYLDRESPEVIFYDKERRIHRGLFQSRNGALINADVNAAYQIMIKAGYGENLTRSVECIKWIKVA